MAGSVSVPAERSPPTGLPSCSSVPQKSRMSSTIWKAMPIERPYSRSDSMVCASQADIIAPPAPAVANSDAVLPWMRR